MTAFDEYLVSKKIDPEKFKNGDKSSYEKFELLFNQVSPASFTQQKLFLINKTRRQYQLVEEKPKQVAKKVVAKPKIKPKANVPIIKRKTDEGAS